jgi:hypothetical protein
MFVTVGVVLAVGAAAAAATNSVAVEGGTPTFTIANNRFILDGEHHRLISGSMHYFRIHPVRHIVPLQCCMCGVGNKTNHTYMQAQWKDRLERAAAMGINTVEARLWPVHPACQANS